MYTDSKFYYFPVKELVVFLLASTVLLVAHTMADLHFWWMIALITLSYFRILGGTHIIRLESDLLRLIALNPILYDSFKIDIKSIHNINSSESFSYESDSTLTTKYHIFRRKYDIEFSDKSGRKRKTRFSINNLAKEKELLKILRSQIAN